MREANGRQSGLSMQSNEPAPPKPATPGMEAAVRSALAWNFATLVFAQIVLAAIFLLLASRLDPLTFGVFALASAMTDIFYSLSTQSSVDSIVQRQDFSRRSLSSITWAGLGICVVVAVGFGLLAPMYANAMNTPQVSGILQVLTLSTILVPFAIGPTAIMRQRLDLKGLALLNMAASLMGGLTALTFSFSPLIEWSLVAQRLVTTVSFIIFATFRTRMVPALTLVWEDVKIWLSSVSRIFVGQGIACLTPRVADLLTGAFFGATAVGYLRVAGRLTELVVGLLVNPLSQLWVTLLSQVQDSPQGKRNVFLHLSNLTALISLPGFVGLALTAKEVVAITLQPEYAPVSGPLAVLALLGAFAPLTNPRNAVFTALRKFNHLVWFAVLDLVITAVAMLVLSPYGAVIMLFGGGITGLVMVIFALPMILRGLHVMPGELVRELTPAYVAVSLMAVCVVGIEPVTAGMPPVTALVVKAAFGAAVYGGTLLLVFRRAVLQTVRAVTAR